MKFNIKRTLASALIAGFVVARIIADARALNQAKT